MEAFLAQCGTIVADHGNVFLSLVLAGFLGSLTHCSTMCGPVVMAQMLATPANIPAHKMLWFYHAGRLTTYGILGMVAAGSSALIFSGASFSHLSGIFLLLAGGLFMLSAIKPHKMHKCGCQHSAVQRMIGHLRIAPSVQFYLRGFLLGFIPCGLVISALLLVATLGSVWVGAVAMFLFGLTTVPVLQLVGFGGRHIGHKWDTAMGLIGRGAMTINGVVLCVMGITIL